jgi:hypothetical protein
MFLSIPAAAILKILLDEIEYLEPWGFLIGGTVPKTLEREPDLPPDVKGK